MRLSLFLPLCLAVGLLTACDSSTEPDHIDADLVENPATAGTPDAEGAVITFKDVDFDFGLVTEGEKVTHDFIFTNTGDAPLLVTGAEASCGCTVPEYDTRPIAPGQQGRIKVRFDSKGKPGPAHKTIRVYANTQPTETVLSIAADVR